MGYLLSIFRLIFFFLIASIATLVFVLLGALNLPHSWIFKSFRIASSAIIFVLGIKVNQHGKVPDTAGVIISNHRSYIDVILMPSKKPYVIVAKRQVKSWPVIGQAATGIKTIYVDRDQAKSRRETRSAIRSRLSEGLSVLIYPEGTTFEGPGILPFKPGMFRTCAEEEFPVIPVALEFRKKEMAWVGDDTFFGHFLKAFSNWKVEVDISIGDPVIDTDPAALQKKVWEWIDAETKRME